MNAEVFSEWLGRRGIRVLRTDSSYWHDQGLRVFQAFPYHRTVDPSADELRGLLRGNKAAALRYSAPIESSVGAVSYHVVLDQPGYSLDKLSGNARRNVRKGLAYAEVQRIPLARLAGEGWKLQSETLERQGRAKAETQERWQRLCLSAEDLPGFEAWAALHEGRMVSSVLAFTCDDWVSILYAQSATNQLKHRVANALLFSISQEMMSRPSISQILHGMHSLDALGSVDEFKFRLDYEPRLVRQRVVLNPLLSPLLGRSTANLAGRLNARRPGMPRLRKFEGMVRMASEGRLPVDQQSPPTVVAQALAEERSADGGGGGSNP